VTNEDETDNEPIIGVPNRAHGHRRRVRKRKKRKWYKRRRVQAAVVLGVAVAVGLSYLLSMLNNASKRQAQPEDLKDRTFDLKELIRNP
jgi:hypothetical protein